MCFFGACPEAMRELQRSTLVKVEVVMLAKDVGGDNGCEVAAVLLIVHAVLDIHEPLGICIALQQTY